MQNETTQRRAELSGIEYLLALSEDHSKLFAESQPDRIDYRRRHLTEIKITKCMDGRCHFALYTETPLGILQPKRNIGGRFNLEWPRFQESVQSWNRYGKSKGRNRLVIATDHYSRSDVHLGCKGFEYDARAAQAASRALKEQFDHVYRDEDGFYTLNCTMETDEEALIFRGEDGRSELDLSAVKDASESFLTGKLRELYPAMPDQILLDLLPLVTGNLSHVAKIRAAKRSLAANGHKEWVVAVGRGFDWLHEINTALIVGPFDPQFLDWVETAGKIVLGNMKNEERRAVLLVSEYYRWNDDRHAGRRLAEMASRVIASQAFEVIKTRVPDLLPYLERLTVTVNLDDLKLDVLERT